MNEMKIHAIGHVHSGEEGFEIVLEPRYAAALEGLEGFSHIQVLWWANGCDLPEGRGLLQVPKPYQKAPDTLGVFATRSPARPNPIALSCAGLLDLDAASGRLRLDYLDAQDGTPVLDLKPYTPSADRVEDPAVPAWCAHWPRSLESSGDFAWEDEFCF